MPTKHLARLFMMIWVAGFLGLMTACGSVSSQEAPQQLSPEAQEPAPQTVPTQAEAVEGAEAYPQPVLTPAGQFLDVTAYPAPANGDSLLPSPTPRQGLQATDPSTVALASGKLQLVEFFAFW